MYILITLFLCGCIVRVLILSLIISLYFTAMVQYAVLLALLLNTCLAIPLFGGNTLHGPRIDFDDELVPEQVDVPTLSDIIMQSFTKHGTTDRYRYTTDPPEEGIYGAGTPTAALQQCLALASDVLNQLLYCIKTLSATQSMHHGDTKRGPLNLNPTGWKRRRRSTTKDRQHELDDLRVQSMIDQLLNKRQNAQPRFNPTGW